MPPLMTPLEIEGLIEDSGGVPVVYGFEKTWGHFGATDGVEFVGIASVKRPDWMVKVPTGRLTDIEQDAEIEVDGDPYTILWDQKWDDGDADFSGDGALTVIFLKPAGAC